MSKRKAEGDIIAEESNLLTITPLGAGQEVGRSCIMLEFKGKKIMLDCGIHPGMNGIESLPYTDMIEAEEIDLLLVSHFHLDHCGGLPWFLEKTSFKGRCFMTHPTRSIYKMLLTDYIKVSNIAHEDEMLYTDKDLNRSLEKIEVVGYHTVKEINGIKFECFQAGHVLGAAMFMIEIAGVKILYTGDFSREEDRHLKAAELPPTSPDILIMESTYGTHRHEKREKREARFTSTVHDIVSRGGRCLIPVFALGRAQELLLILDEYWASHPELHEIPIYYGSSLAKKCMNVYKTFLTSMNDRINRQAAISNPFNFKHILNSKRFDDIGPSVVLASPGMMQSGLSRELFEAWCSERKNGVIIAGYCVENTLAKQILSETTEITSMSGKKLPVKMQVSSISFSAHTDYDSSSEFVRLLKPSHIVLVHGEPNEMSKLRSALQREYEDNEEIKFQLHTPRNTQEVDLSFRGEKMAKVMGILASSQPDEGKELSGILIKRGFKHHLVDPEDLSNYTDLAISTVKQQQTVTFQGLLSSLKHLLQQISPTVKSVSHQNREALLVFNEITVIKEDKTLTLEWIANAVNDMYADAVLTVVLQVETNPLSIQASKQQLIPGIPNPELFPKRLVRLYREMFGDSAVKADLRDPSQPIRVVVDDRIAFVYFTDMVVECEDDQFSTQLSNAMKRLSAALVPLQV